MGVPTDNEQINLSRSIGGSGSILISAGQTITGIFWGFVVNTDAVVTVLVSSYDASTYISQERIDLTGKTISANMLISANCLALFPKTKIYISSITTISGDVIAYYD